MVYWAFPEEAKNRLSSLFWNMPAQAKKKNPWSSLEKPSRSTLGGFSLKPAENMEQMKADMTGGAEVLATVLAVARLRAHLNVIGILPVTENMPGGRANQTRRYSQYAVRENG